MVSICVGETKSKIDSMDEECTILHDFISVDIFWGEGVLVVNEHNNNYLLCPALNNIPVE